MFRNLEKKVSELIVEDGYNYGEAWNIVTRPYRIGIFVILIGIAICMRMAKGEQNHA